MTQTTRLFLLAAALAACAFAQAPQAQKGKTKPTPGGGSFAPGCPLPFQPAPGLSIDKTCGFIGNAVANTPEALQNQAKNNFCAAGAPVTVTPAILLSLQQATEAAGISFGNHALLPKDRSALQKGITANGRTYKEGDRVRMAAFFIETHPADLTSGESVNCAIKTVEGNDVHMALGLAYGANECTSVTAELSPHFRPAAWSVMEKIDAKDKTSKPAPVTQFPIRVEGQLFFDASHKPCSGGKEIAGDPARQSLWEIHPVYQVDVCSFRTLAQCPVESADASVWTPVDKWKAPAK